MSFLTRRQLYGVIAAMCAAAMGYALYAQYVLELEPCPLCIFQRIGVIAVGSLALLAAIFNPQGLAAKVWSLLIAVAAVAGGSVSAWQVYLQHLPPEQVPACGPGLDYMLETLPMTQVLEKVFKGSGECAQIDWTFLGQSMPFWVGAFLLSTLLLALYNGWRQTR